ncbi:MAG: tocopherol cyclase family protein [Acholeplasmataceae bacterium]|nr:tocopherol cyclase family protein [Acholeplasmataceae bacterium]
MYFKKLIHPEYFQGNKKKKNYFEGWYYKLVSHDEKYTLAFIPGVSINDQDTHAFIQVFISQTVEKETKLKSHYFRFRIEEFEYSHQQFFVRIGSNFFSKERISIDLSSTHIKVFGNIVITETTPLKKTILAPNIMGLFGYLNFMECYHGVVSMSHQINGILKINSSPVSFHLSKGYIEKDWGKSFPRAYVWMQSNHFSNSNTSFMFSYADIPFIGLYFKGLIANLIYEGKEYRFATYNFAKVKLEEIRNNHVHYVLKKGRYKLDIEAASTTQIGLASPKNGMMVNQIKEGLSGFIRIKLYKGKTLIFEDKGNHAGIEIMK